ncbi:MAG: hypothetical protein EOP04_12780 [Proteobacteria bacterium]|nr:MAG: hypothetical protein EOP04_12780 [Pseudomonadota bacterium]
MSDMPTVEVQPTPFAVNRLARFPRKIIPWQWTWIQTLVISFGMSSGSSYYHWMDDYDNEEDISVKQLRSQLKKMKARFALVLLLHAFQINPPSLAIHSVCLPSI